MSMVPLSDSSRRPGHFPFVTVGIIALNAFVFLLELMGGDAFINQWSLIPASLSSGQRWITMFSAMFMHAGWMHIIGNMVFLKAFGPEIEDAMGRSRYLAFYLLCGLAATLAQVGMMPDSTVPNLGASGAIAGVMGAFIVTYPRDRIRTLLFFGIFVRIAQIPAVLLIGFWFLIQLFNQVGAVAVSQSGGVAYAAHVGGFIFGAIAARFFRRAAEFEEWET